MKLNIKFWNFKVLLIFFLIITYQLDQLYNAIFPHTSLPSPFKAIMCIFVVYSLLKPLSSGNLLQKRAISILSLLVFWAFVCCIWSDNFWGGLSYSFQMFILLFFTINCLFYLRTIPNILELILFFLCITGGIIAALSISGFFSPVDLDADHRITFLGIGLNAIAISTGYIFMTSLSLLFYPNVKNNYKYIIIICLILMLLSIIRTGTRSVIWGVALSFIISLTCTIKFFSFKRLLLYGLLAVGFIIGLNNIIDSGFIGDKLINRITVIDEKSFTENIRIEVWEQGVNWYIDNIGGTGTANEAAIYRNRDVKEAHNVFISALLQMNVVGLLVLISFFFYLIKNTLKLSPGHLKLTAILLLSFFLFQTIKGSFLQTRLFWHPITILMLILEISDFQKQKTGRFLYSKTESS